MSRFPFLILLLLVVPTLLFSKMAPVFGPKQYIRDLAKPEAVVDSFQNCEPAAQYQIVVTNGNPGNTDRVSSASISLNGTEVIGAQDFNQKVSGITKPVKLLGQNQLEVKLASQPGSSLTIDIECTSGCLNIEITSPSSGGSLSLDATNILGSVTSSADELGVAVNGITGFVSGQQFAVPDFPLVLGTNQLTAVATNACGNQATTTIQINTTAINKPPVTLIAAPTGGIGPATVSFTADVSSLNPVSQYQWEFGEDGGIDASGPGLFQVSHTYNQPGIFLATVFVTDSQGNQFSQQRPILIFSRDQLTAILTNRWKGLKGAFSAEKVEVALQFFHPGTTAKFRELFAQLDGQLPEIAVGLGDVGLLSLFGGVAELITVLPKAGGGSAVYFIYAMQDQDGLWKFVAM